MTNTRMEPDVDPRRAHRERRCMENHHSRVASLALAAAIAMAAGACDGGDPTSGTRANEAASANESSTMVPQTASGPFSSIQAQLGEQEVNLFEVEAPNAEYWRLFTLDRYDGETWTSSDPEGSQSGQTLPTPATLPQAPGYTYPADAESLNQTFRILSDLDSAHALPMAQTAEEIAGPIGDITWDPSRAQAFIDGGLEEGMEYTVRSRIVVPTPEELDQVDYRARQAYGLWTELPADLDPRIGQIAERWTADATSDYRKVLAIQQHFVSSGDFHYSLDVRPRADADALVDFLTRTKAGFCQQYTTAMAVMVRELGIPARVAVGFRPGSQSGDTFTVSTKDAHSWVEVLFPGYGWLQFEPEPELGAPHPNAQAGTYLNP